MSPTKDGDEKDRPSFPQLLKSNKSLHIQMWRSVSKEINPYVTVLTAVGPD